MCSSDIPWLKIQIKIFLVFFFDFLSVDLNRVSYWALKTSCQNLALLFIFGNVKLCSCCYLVPLLQNIEGVSSKLVVRLTPDQEASGHPLGPASLVLSPHNIWLSSVGRDGLVRLRETSAMVVEAASLKYSHFTS